MARPLAATALLGALLALTLLAGAVRVVGLNAPDGEMNEDEARLAMAAEGILRTGLPVLPSGRVYSRGLLNSYLTAPSLALLGRGDFAARLPSALAGTLLVPVAFLLGRALGRTDVGLAAAAFAAFAEPLVSRSRMAWFPSLFMLLFTLSVYCTYRGFVGRRAGWQVAGAAFFCLAALSYEFAILLPTALLAYLGLRTALGSHDWYLGRPTLVALGLHLAGVGLFGALALALRVGTQAGPLAEVDHFFSPGLRTAGPAYYARLLDDYAPLFAAALVGLPLLARTHPRGVIYLAPLLALGLLIPAFVVQVKNVASYILPALPPLAALAAAGTTRLVDVAGERLGMASRLRGLLAASALLLLFGLALRGDVAAALRRLEDRPARPTWLQLLGQEQLGPADLIVTDSKEVVRYYLGRDEFYLRPMDNQRYVVRVPEGFRSIYTGSLLIRRRGDFERLVEDPNPGRTAWLLVRKHRLGLQERIDPTLWPSLLASAERVVETPDGWIMLRLVLPRSARPA